MPAAGGEHFAALELFQPRTGELKGPRSLRGAERGRGAIQSRPGHDHTPPGRLCQNVVCEMVMSFVPELRRGRTTRVVLSLLWNTLLPVATGQAIIISYWLPWL